MKVYKPKNTKETGLINMKFKVVRQMNIRTKQIGWKIERFFG